MNGEIEALLCDLRAAAALGRPLLDSDVDLIEAALAARQPVGQEPVAWHIKHPDGLVVVRKEQAVDEYMLKQGPADGLIFRPLVFGDTAPPAPAAVPVDVVRDAERYRWLREQSGADISIEEADDDGDMVFVSGHSAEELDEAVDKALQLDRMVSKAHDRFEAAIATHPPAGSGCPSWVGFARDGEAVRVVAPNCAPGATWLTNNGRLERRLLYALASEIIDQQDNPKGEVQS